MHSFTGPGIATGRNLVVVGGAVFSDHSLGVGNLIKDQFYIHYDAEFERVGLFTIGCPDLDAVGARGEPIEVEFEPAVIFNSGFLARGGVAVECFNFHIGRCVAGEHQRFAVVDRATSNRAILANDFTDDRCLGRQDENVLKG
ncbi:hypothetical protein D3C76_892650 [compost metagenome]